MNTCLNYMIEANLGLCFFLILYYLMLWKETDFSLKRIFIITGIITSVFFPFIHLEATGQLTPFLNTVIPFYWLPAVEINGERTMTASTTIDRCLYYAAIIYITGVFVFLALFVYQLARLLTMIHQAATYRIGKFIISESSAGYPSFSFFNFIFIGQKDRISEQEKQQIIQHECVHGQRLHSLDILLLNMITIFFWFNPLLSIYKKILVQLHEFEADARAVRNGDVNEYCNLLAKVALFSANVQLANHFNHSLTVKRIIMMRTIKNKIKPWKVITMTIVMSAFCFLVICQETVMAQDKEKVVIEPSTSNEVFTVVEQVPVYYDNGQAGMIEFLSKEMRYPEKARKDKIEGTVFTSFIVEKDGSVTDVKIVKGVADSMDAEAKRVVAQTRWIPGTQGGKAVRVRFVLPIKFKL